VLMLPVPRPGVLRAVEGQAEAAATPGITGLSITIPVGQRVRPLPDGDRYLGFIFAEGDTQDRVEQALSVARDRLRTDISFRATMNAVQVVASPELSARYPEQWPARVRLTAGASTYYAKADEVPGEREHSPAALQVKLRNFCAAPGSPDARGEAAGRIASRSLSATSVDELRELTTVIDGETAEGIRDFHV